VFFLLAPAFWGQKQGFKVDPGSAFGGQAFLIVVIVG